MSTDEVYTSDFAQRTINVGGLNLIVQIWDVAGQDKDSSSITRQFSRDAHGVIWVSDISKQNVSCFDSILLFRRPNDSWKLNILEIIWLLIKV